jgi:oxygen-independent coproporphyrinogen-3 oxidase
VRWWNVKHPNTYAELLERGEPAVAGFESLGERDRHIEDVLLGIRLRRGLAVEVLTGAERRRARRAVEAGLLNDGGDRLVLTDRGRLLADAVVRDLLDD